MSLGFYYIRTKIPKKAKKNQALIPLKEKMNYFCGNFTIYNERTFTN